MTAADVLVVGAGGAGAVVAARLSENADRRVVLLESGHAWSTDSSASGRLLSDASSLQASINPLTSQSYPGTLVQGRPWGAARGWAIGGSTAVNAGYFLRARASDLALWQARSGWTAARTLAAYRRSETDIDYGDDPEHGASGPIQVQRPDQDDPITAALSSAAHTRGAPLVPDANHPSARPGFAALPRNVTCGRRWDTGRAYLLPALGRANLEVITGAHVLTVEITSAYSRLPRATGVTVRRNGVLESYRAGEIIVCAGAIESAHLLLLSGIGPATDLEALGRTVVANLPVGRSTSDHPQIALPWTPGEVAAVPEPVRSVLHQGDVEILPLLQPTPALLGHSHHGESDDPGPVLDLLIADQAPQARGDLRLDPRDPAGHPVLHYRYLETARDRDTMRVGVRLGVDLIRGAGGTVASGGPQPADLASDEALDAWVRAKLGTALHGSGSAPAGISGDARAVVNPQGRVLGVDGLRVIDLSVLPQVPSRGPAATAIMLGELLTEHDLEA